MGTVRFFKLFFFFLLFLRLFSCILTYLWVKLKSVSILYIFIVLEFRCCFWNGFLNLNLLFFLFIFIHRLKMIWFLILIWCFFLTLVYFIHIVCRRSRFWCRHENRRIWLIFADKVSLKLFKNFVSSFHECLSMEIFWQLFLLSFK